VGKRSSGVPAAALVEALDSMARPESRFPGVPDSTPCEICAVSGLSATAGCPGTLTEYLPRGRPLPPPCDLHRNGAGAQAIRGRGLAGEARGLVSAAEPDRPSAAEPDRPSAVSHPDPARIHLRFVHPRDGAVFYFDPTLKEEDQAIGIRLEGLESLSAGKTAWLYVDGAARTPIPADGKLLIPLLRGETRLSLVSGGKELAFARMSVR
jgi:hypothetical protein